MNPDLYTALQKKINDATGEHRYNSYDELYHSSHQRQNVFRWYPFGDCKTILHLGSECGITTEYLCTKAKVYCVEDNEDMNNLNQLRNPEAKIYKYSVEDFIRDFHEKVDYIIIDGYLDRYDCKQAILEKCQTILNKHGTMIILTNNKLSLRYFAGVKEGSTQKLFGNFSSKSHLFSKREWETLLNNNGLSFQFVYPYPHYTFSEYIFTKTPSISDLTIKYEEFEERGVRFFDQEKGIKEIAKSGYFEDFNNSFMIIVSPHHNISYVKFACERRREFQIYTTIKEENGMKKVLKTPIYECGHKHMEKIYEYYLRFKKSNKNPKIDYCPVQLINNQLCFDFIDGKSLEELVLSDAMNQDMKAIKEKLNVIDELASIGHPCSFEEKPRFLEVFGQGDYSKLQGLECYEYNNIDLIFDNILINDKYNVIDYEWVFNCFIPKSFIIFRTIFHSQALAKLSDHQRDELYNDYGITLELKEIYMDMEYSFQNYVSSFKLSDVYKQLDCSMLPYQSDNKLFKQIRVYQNEMIYKETLTNSNEFNKTITINSQDDIKITLGDKAIFKIHDIQLDGKSISQWESNASYQSNQTYFFDQLPIIKIANQGASQIYISLTFYYYGDKCIGNIQEMTQYKNQLDRLREYRIVRFIERRGK